MPNNIKTKGNNTMSTSKVNTIEKFEGSFSKEKGGCTIVVNSTINSITNAFILGIYSYLMCKPDTWQLNVKQLMSHFNCSKNTIYKCLTELMRMNLLTREDIREKGKFSKSHYRLYEKPHIDEEIEPCPSTRDTVSRDTVLRDTYKTKNIQNKESNNNIVDAAHTTTVDNFEKPIQDKEKSVDDYKKDPLFMKFYNAYPNKQKPREAYKVFVKLKADEAFVGMVLKDIDTRCEKDIRWKTRQYTPHPATYLNSDYWLGDIVRETPKPHYPTKSEKAANEEKIREREERAEKMKYEEIVGAKRVFSGLRDFKTILGGLVT